jgi:hypothetical protein
MLLQGLQTLYGLLVKSSAIGLYVQGKCASKQVRDIVRNVAPNQSWETALDVRDQDGEGLIDALFVRAGDVDIVATRAYNRTTSRSGTLSISPRSFPMRGAHCQLIAKVVCTSRVQGTKMS